MADISQVKLPNGDTYNLVDETSGYIKNYTETDPVFSASAAAGITSTDISNWNAKVSKSGDTMSGNLILGLNNNSPSKLQLNYNASNYITLQDNGVEGNVGYLLLGNQTNAGATTGNVRIRGVANPALTYDAANKKYVDDSIPKVYSSTNTGGYLTMATLPIYDGTVE